MWCKWGFRQKVKFTQIAVKNNLGLLRCRSLPYQLCVFLSRRYVKRCTMHFHDNQCVLLCIVELHMAFSSIWKYRVLPRTHNNEFLLFCWSTWRCSQRYKLKCPIFLSDFNQICIFSTYLNKSPQCYKNSSSGSRVDTYVVGSKSFRPDIQKPRQMENTVSAIYGEVNVSVGKCVEIKGDCAEK